MNMNQSPPPSHGLLRAFYRSAAILCFDYAYVQPHPQVLTQVPFQFLAGESRAVNIQPRPQGLLAFQYGGGRREDPGTQRTKTIADWCISLRDHTFALIGLFLPKQKWWLPGFFVEIENSV